MRTSEGHHSWGRHFALGLLLGALVLLLSVSLEACHSPLAVALENAGDDAAQRVFAQGNPPRARNPRQPLVIVEIDSATLHSWGQGNGASEVAGLARLVQALATYNPKVIILDQVVRETVASTNAQLLVEAIRAAHPSEVVLIPRLRLMRPDGRHAVAAPDSEAQLYNLRRTDAHVRFAVPALTADPDGVVRHVPQTVCLTWGGNSMETLPNLGTSLTAPRQQEGCGASNASLRIAYRVPEAAFLSGRATALRGISATAVLEERNAAIDELLRGAIVLIGETGPTAWTDRHLTPVGAMPGVLVQANAILTAEDDPQLEEKGSQLFRKLLIEVPTVIVVALVFATFLWLMEQQKDRVLRVFFVLSLGCIVIATRSLLAAVAATVAAAVLLSFTRQWRGVWLHLLTFSLCLAAVVVLVGSIWVWVGESQLSHGHHVGSMIPAVAAGLEGLVKGGNLLVAALGATLDRLALMGRWVVRTAWPWLLFHAVAAARWSVQAGRWTTRFIGRQVGKRGAAAFLAALMPAGAVAADGPSAMQEVLVRPAPEAVRVHRNAERVQPDSRGNYQVAVGDLLELEPGAQVRIGPLSVTGPTYFYVPPPPEAPVGGSVQRAILAFMGLVRQQGPSPGVRPSMGERWRDPSTPLGAASAGPLRWHPLLLSGESLLTTGPGGLTLVWSGGAPPYRVTLEGEQSGRALGSFALDQSFFWQPGFAMADEPVIVLVRDVQQRSRLSTRILPATVPVPRVATPEEEATAPAAAAMALFVEGGATWRLEALRRLSALAPGSPQASAALAEVRAAAGTGSP